MALLGEMPCQWNLTTSLTAVLWGGQALVSMMESIFGSGWWTIKSEVVRHCIDKENSMQKTWRMPTLGLVVCALMAAGNVVGAEGHCEQAAPAQHDKGITLKISIKEMSAHDIARAGQAMRDGQFSPYQKPMLSDKGICHQKPGGLKGTISM